MSAALRASAPHVFRQLWLDRRPAPGQIDVTPRRGPDRIAPGGNAHLRTQEATTVANVTVFTNVG